MFKQFFSDIINIRQCGYVTLVGTSDIFTAFMASSKFSSSSGTPSLFTRIPARQTNKNPQLILSDIQAGRHRCHGGGGGVSTSYRVATP